MDKQLSRISQMAGFQVTVADLGRHDITGMHRLSGTDLLDLGPLFRELNANLWPPLGCH